MNKELQEKLKAMQQAKNPVDEVVKTMLKSQSNCCVRAKVKLDELEKQDEKK
jgi:hypothetical protein